MGEVQTALEFARAVRGPFIFVPEDASEEVRKALAEEAAATKRELLGGTAIKTQSAKLAEKFAGADLPTVDGADHRAFLRNLKKIAAGKVRVV